MSETKTHKGACHCGAFEVEMSLDGLVECNCSHCCRKGFVRAFTPRSAFRLTRGEGATTSYVFNKHNIEHRFCKTCGVQPFGYGKGPGGSEWRRSTCARSRISSPGTGRPRGSMAPASERVDRQGWRRAS
jgi:hypothetical protein